MAGFDRTAPRYCSSKCNHLTRPIQGLHAVRLPEGYPDSCIVEGEPIIRCVPVWRIQLADYH